MVAGATGIDLFLMVVAADDGVMRQTREHAAVLPSLGVTRGVVAVTKADLGETDDEPIRDLLGDIEIVRCSTRTGEGVDEVRAALDRVAAQLELRETEGEPVLHVDRVFTVHGAGTVVTGTLWSGSIGRGDDLRILPSGRDRAQNPEHHEPLEIENRPEKERQHRWHEGDHEDGHEGRTVRRSRLDPGPLSTAARVVG